MKVKVPFDSIPFSKWTIYKMPLPPNPPTQHFIIIIANIENSIHYLYVTSKIDKAKKVSKNDLLSLVEVTKTDWGKLDRDSCIQCNKSHIYEIQKEELRNIYDKEKIEYIEKLPENVKDKIIQAISKSKTLNGKEKETYKS
jgi:hypothetical protein